MAVDCKAAHETCGLCEAERGYTGTIRRRLQYFGGRANGFPGIALRPMTDRRPAAPDTRTFTHYQHAHCESGVTTNLLRHAGIQITEPLAFGIGAGLFFGHLPFLKVSGTP